MTVDDCLDYDIDIKIERTKTRPIPRGAITPSRAWLFCIAQATIGVVLALLLLQPRTFVLCIQLPHVNFTDHSDAVCLCRCLYGRCTSYTPHARYARHKTSRRRLNNSQVGLSDGCLSHRYPWYAIPQNEVSTLLTIPTGAHVQYRCFYGLE